MAGAGVVQVHLAIGRQLRITGIPGCRGPPCWRVRTKHHIRNGITTLCAWVSSVEDGVAVGGQGAEGEGAAVDDDADQPRTDGGQRGGEVVPAREEVAQRAGRQVPCQR